MVTLYNLIILYYKLIQGMVLFNNLRLPSKIIEEYFDVVVVGGGLAGVVAAIASARNGVKTAIVHDRPVFGGNSSSEIRVAPGGATLGGAWARETGIIEELLIEERARNHDYFVNGRINSVWDLVLYEWVTCEPNLKAFLNTRVIGVEMKNDYEISSVVGVQLGTEKIFKFYGKFFIDCTGDGTVGAAAGAEYRIGREARDEFGESLAPKNPDRVTQGTSLLFKTVNISKKAEFVLPEWAVKFEDPTSLKYREPVSRDTPYGTKEYSGYWWIEIGYPYDSIEDNEKIRHELLRHLLGIWDLIKRTRSDASNQALDWVGMVPGKRESRRLIGDYILNENDLKNRTLFYDRVAYGGWPIDIHVPGGILARDLPPEPTCGDFDLKEKVSVFPYPIPLRCLYSKNISNLFMAGRDISATHVALGSTRLMLTGAVEGQAVGTAAALCVKKNVKPRDIVKIPKLLWELQQTLIKYDAFIPRMPNKDPNDLALKASALATSEMTLSLEPTGEYQELDIDVSQIFPVSGNKIDYIELYVKSKLEKTEVISVKLMEAPDIWSFNEVYELLAYEDIEVPPGLGGWVKIDLDIKVRPRKLYRLDIIGKGGLFVSKSKPEVGVAAAVKRKKWKRWMHTPDVYAMRISPPSKPYGAYNVNNGYSRPEEWTNIWISDPNKPLPQSVTLDFGESVVFNTVYITFDTNLHFDTHRFPPFYRVPQCVKDYDILAFDTNRWIKVVSIRGNYHRFKIHRFTLVKASKLQVKVLKTNGDPSARIYQIRVYNE
ncbi:MAG: hypothetical protein DRJ64_10095 [Thermoprotei archaeon]|nr:MAG: hypothetical protein DRJ64_10095 [Thermoprotei archaeon]